MSPSPEAPPPDAQPPGEHPAPTDDLDRGERVRVDRGRADHRALRATGPVAAGEVILVAEGEVVDRTSRFTLQIGEAAHLAPPKRLDGPVDGLLWPYLNHSRRPNTRLDGRRLVAIEAIEAGDELTFDYNANEWDMASPFRCLESGEWVAGYRHLSPAERAARAPVAPWLKALAAADAPDGGETAR